MHKTNLDIKENNEAVIIKAIIESKSISRAQLSVLTGLTKPSVTTITKRLLDSSLIEEHEIGTPSSLGGRKPIMLKFNPKSALSIGINIREDGFDGTLNFLDGAVIDHFSKNKITISEENTLQELVAMLNMFFLNLPSTPHGVIGITISIHGTVENNKIIFVPHYSLDSIDLVEEISKIFMVPVYLENGANLAALAEYAFSTKYDNLISLNVYGGIGAGIIEKGELLIGHNGQGGEVGHTTLYPNGKLCPCGNHGCLEQYAANDIVISTIEKKLQRKSISLSEVKDLYYQNNQIVVNSINEMAYHLSIGVQSLVAIIAPDIIFLNNPLSKEIPEILKILNDHLSSRFSKDTTVLNSPLGYNAIQLGTTINNTQRFLNVKNLKFI